MVYSKIKHKIKSRRGASLIYALLILLVCTVIASVVLTAATAAAGRIVKTSETDRRYYAVNSAVNMVKDILTEAEYSFEWTYRETKTVIAETTVDYLKNSSYSETVGTPTYLSELLMEQEETDWQGNTSTVMAAAKYGTRNMENLSDIFLNASLDLLVGTDRVIQDDVDTNTETFSLATAWNTTTFHATDTNMTLSIIMEGINRRSASQVTLSSSLASDGTLTVIITANQNTDNNTAYSVKMIFRPEIDDNTTISNNSDTKVGTAQTSYDNQGRTVTTQELKRVVEKDRKVTYKWNLDSMVTIDNSGSSTGSN